LSTTRNLLTKEKEKTENVTVVESLVTYPNTVGIIKTLRKSSPKNQILKGREPTNSQEGILKEIFIKNRTNN